MKKMFAGIIINKVVFLVAMVVVGSLLASVKVFSAGGAPLYINGPGSVQKGSDAVYDIRINATGYRATMVNLAISYDATKLEPKNTQLTLSGVLDQVDVNSVSGGTISYLAIAIVANPLTSDVSLGTIAFNAKSSGSTTLTFGTTRVDDDSIPAVNITGSLSNKSISITDPPPPPPPPPQQQEVCGDGSDNDGDGRVDEDCPQDEEDDDGRGNNDDQANDQNNFEEPTPSGLSIENISSSGGELREPVIAWTTSIPATGRVEYGPDPESLLLVADQPNLSTEHSVALSMVDFDGLDTVFYRIAANDESGNATTSDIQSLTLGIVPQEDYDGLIDDGYHYDIEEQQGMNKRVKMYAYMAAVSAVLAVVGAVGYLVYDKFYKKRRPSGDPPVGGTSGQDLHGSLIESPASVPTPPISPPSAGMAVAAGAVNPTTFIDDLEVEMPVQQPPEDRLAAATPVKINVTSEIQTETTEPQALKGRKRADDNAGGFEPKVIMPTVKPPDETA